MEIPKDIIISTSGIRGKWAGTLTPQFVKRLAIAFSNISPAGSIVVSRDSRESGVKLKNAVIEGLTQCNRQVLDAEIIPLPTTQIAVLKTHSAGAIDVTASHNPIEWNGLKFLGPDGEFIRQKILDNLLDNFSQKIIKQSTNNRESKIIYHEAINWHIGELKKNAITGKVLTIAVDAVNGAGSDIIPKFLREINCDVIEIATDRTQPFPRTPEPIPKNLAWTQTQLSGKNFDLCVVVDPDADRLVLIDEKNNLLSEEVTLPLVLKELIAEGRKGNVVVNLSTSRMITDIASQNGLTVIRAKVGEINVVDKMKENMAIFGGEGNGGVIDPQIHFGRDSLVGILYIINLLRRTGKTINQLASGLPQYKMKKIKIENVDISRLSNIYALIEKKLPKGHVNREDGLRIDWEDSWVQVRPSNTESVIRIIAEAKTDIENNNIIEKVKSFF